MPEHFFLVVIVFRRIFRIPEVGLGMCGCRIIDHLKVRQSVLEGSPPTSWMTRALASEIPSTTFFDLGSGSWPASFSQIIFEKLPLRMLQPRCGLRNLDVVLHTCFSAATVSPFPASSLGKGIQNYDACTGASSALQEEGVRGGILSRHAYRRENRHRQH